MMPYKLVCGGVPTPASKLPHSPPHGVCSLNSLTLQVRRAPMDKFDQEQADKAIARKLEIGEPLTKFDKLLGKHQQATKVVLLLDTSGSMDSPADSLGERRIDALRGVVATLRQKQLAFPQASFHFCFLLTE